MNKINKAKGVKFKEAPIRKWLSAHKGAKPTMGQASSSSVASMPLLDLSGLDQHAEFLHVQLSEEPAITAVVLRDKLIQDCGVSCSDRTMRSWLERARATAPKRAIKRGDSDLPTLENLDAYGDYFLKEPQGRGEQFITNIFLTLKPSAMEFNLTPKLNEVAGELQLTAVMDVFT